MMIFQLSAMVNLFKVLYIRIKPFSRLMIQFAMLMLWIWTLKSSIEFMALKNHIMIRLARFGMLRLYVTAYTSIIMYV